MMLLTIFSFVGVEAWGVITWLGYGLLAGLIIALVLSSQRWLLLYLFGGMAYWLAVEVVQNVLSGSTMFSELSEWHRYVIAMGVSWLPLAGWVLYRALRYDDVSQSVQQQRALEAARYIEHTPVYDDDYKPRFH
ncbi:AciT family ciprofloxacin tolerance protein [Psychrobacter sp. SWN149]|uniref:AciT family ciprofloxacin tolerance protein n=1 Tax=Psychrobacter sp. SWN149 TaxID=2792057 RepID=UPI001D11FD54|nr:AciT family ciprofloxacin tolerance protein [Psychrobacter sp. SWN149]